jgi:6-phosphogluconate dehydrogenase
LLLAPYFKQIADEYQQALRDVVAYAVQNGIPVPTFSAAIAYYDSYRSAVLPANLIQAQRDYLVRTPISVLIKKAFSILSG